MRFLSAVVAALLSLGVARAQSLEEVDRREAAMLEAWEATPLTVRKALFVEGDPIGFGMYRERASNVFRPTDHITVYAELVGYGWKKVGGLFELGLTADFLLKSPGGNILTGKEKFTRASAESHSRNYQFMIVLTGDLTDMKPDDYVLEYKLRDLVTGKTVSFELPMSVKP